MQIKKENWSIEFEINTNSAKIKSGNFGNLELIESPLFCAEFENLITKEIITINSFDTFKVVKCINKDDNIAFNFETEENIVISLKGSIDNKGISWETEIINKSDLLTVTNVSYPVLKVKNDIINVFVPQQSGRVFNDFAKETINKSYDYPAHGAAIMQYFAFYNNGGGVYMGIHDPRASIKCFKMNVEKGNIELIPQFIAIGASLKNNSFKLGGTARWEFIQKDWYDATEIYAEFVHENAKWIPQKGDNGRVDTPDRFKDVPLWIMDYIPNSEKQLEARPMTLGTVSAMYGKDYWFDAPVELKKKLGVPIAYHVYNWHDIPFNINYPHFTPARDEFKRGLKHLKDADIYVLPYINAVSWETKDADENFEINFDNTGIKGASIEPSGKYSVYDYPQVKASGEKTLLAPICPGFTPWHDIIGDIAKEMEDTLDIDGIYFDEVSAHYAHPCRSIEHGHLPCGGSHWSDNYNIMMSKIRKNKPKDNYYFSESNCEGFMTGFDGMLTWLWQAGDLVPAFPRVYSGCVQMIGRFTDGLNRENDDFFRFHIAQELIFGQQLGWIHPNVVYNNERLEFLKKAVDIRYKYSNLFNSGKLLRPPVITTDVLPLESAGIVMNQIQGGLWQTADSDKKVLFVINVSKNEANCHIEYDTTETELNLKPYEFYVKEF